MKNLLTVLLFIMSLQLYSQKTTTTIYDDKIGTISCKFSRTIDLSNSDTSYYVYCGFQNQKYSSITDLGSVFITDQKGLLKIIEELKGCLKYMDDKSNNYSVDLVSYGEVSGSLTLYDFSKNLYVTDRSDLLPKYTTLNKKKVIKWISWLEMVGNDNLLR